MRSWLGIALLVQGVVQAASLLIQDNPALILLLHNQLRAKHNAPPLKWSRTLAQESKDYVETCNYYENSVHSNATNNVALGYSDWHDTVEGWYSGLEYYDFDHPGYLEDAGTFIAMVWQSSTHLGCASFDCGRKVGRLYQCQYSPSIPLSLAYTEKEYRDNVHE
jgi:hypothetical protein